VDTDCTSRSDSGHGCESGDGLGSQETKRSAAGRKNVLANAESGSTLGAAAEENGEELARAKGVCSVRAQALAWTLGGGELADCQGHYFLSVRNPEKWPFLRSALEACEGERNRGASAALINGHATRFPLAAFR
jgi:hypothetical protein